MASKSENANTNKIVLAGAAGALVVGSVLILAYKGYFSPAPHDPRRNEARFTNFAKKAAETPWEAAAPTELADQLKFRIERDAERFKDKRFDGLKTRFQSLEQAWKQGKQSNTEYQASLIALGNSVDLLEDELDPDAKSGNGNGGNGNGNGGNGGKAPPPAVKGEQPPGGGNNPVPPKKNRRPRN